MNRERDPLGGIRSNMPGIAWPPVSTGATAALVAFLRQLEHTQWLSPADILARQFRQIGLVAEYANAHSKHFAARLARAGLLPRDLASADGLRRLPLLTRHDIQSAGADLFCDQVPEGHAPLTEHRTSGSTGEPLMTKRTTMGQLGWLAMTMREHLWQQRNFTGRLAAVRANISEYREQEDWGPPASLLFRTGRSAGIPTGTDIVRLYDLLAAFQPDNFLVYPSILDALVRHMTDRKLSLPGVRHIRTIGETLAPNVREEAKAVFNAHLADCYSSQEVGYVAIECPVSGHYHVMAEALFVEILDDAGTPCPPGEIGRVVITDLHNFATPLIRYDIGDYAEAGDACPCGRGLPVLTRVLGRERNLILMPDGSRFWPLTGGRYLREIAPVTQFQMIQHDRERMETRLVVERPLTPAEEAAVIARIQKSLRHAFRIELVYFDGRIPVGRNGKFEEFICKAT